MPTGLGDLVAPLRLCVSAVGARIVNWGWWRRGGEALLHDSGVTGDVVPVVSVEGVAGGNAGQLVAYHHHSLYYYVGQLTRLIRPHGVANHAL